MTNKKKHWTVHKVRMKLVNYLISLSNLKKSTNRIVLTSVRLSKLPKQGLAKLGKQLTYTLPWIYLFPKEPEDNKK